MTQKEAVIEDRMTQKEAVIKALETLGGKGTLNQIYPIAIHLIGENTKSQKIKNNIRRELYTNPMIFKPTPGVKGSWELLSYQEEIARRDRRIAELEEENRQLKMVETKATFLKYFVFKLKETFKFDVKILIEIRKIFLFLECDKAAKELDDFIAEKEKPQLPFAGDIVLKKDVYQDNQIDVTIGQFAAENNGNMNTENKTTK